MRNRNYVKDARFGVAIGDALGVPVEFFTRYAVTVNPVAGMREYGTHHQPAGTWSDDSSLTFCLAEMLCMGYDLQDLGNRFVNWREHGYWTPAGHVFDIGIATSAAIQSLLKGCAPTLAGGRTEDSNGNGSLMRIMPLLFYIKDRPIEERYRITQDISSLTHAHIRSVNACFMYLEMALQILNGKGKMEAYENMVKLVNSFLHDNPICSEAEINKFHRILCNPISNYEIKPIYEFDEDEIYSSGYVLNTLEASIWCILKTDNYKDAVLKAVNLGSDTDTTGAVTGGLAGLLYGYETIPEEWINVLARRKDIDNLSERLYAKMYE